MSLSSLARDALAELQRDVTSLQRACGRAFWDDDEAVCLNVAGEGLDFLNDRAPRLLARVDAGDVNAGEDLVRGARNIRRAVLDEAARVDAEMTAGALLERFAQEVIVQTGRDIPDKAPGKAAKLVLGLLALALGVKVAADLAGGSVERNVRRVKAAAKDDS